jgi:hypothetical protein
MAGRQGRDGLQARCLREKRARKRRARGEDSLVRVLRRVRTVGSSSAGGGEVAEGAMIVFVVFGRCSWLWCGGEIYLREISPLAGSIPRGRAASLLAAIVWHSETPSSFFLEFLSEGTIIHF